MNLTEDGYFDGVLYYKITSESALTVSVSKADENATIINIPTVVKINNNHYSVTSIGDEAFARCKVNSVTIPESVETIGENAFLVCQHLNSISIPSSVTTIGSHAFFNCTRMSSVSIGYGVTNIGDFVFS